MEMISKLNSLILKDVFQTCQRRLLERQPGIMLPRQTRCLDPTRARLKKPSWDFPKILKGGTWIPLEELKDILEFALDNAYIKMPDGTIRHQVQGIPMGDPLSPGMTIMTCAWMEREWMSGLRAMDTIFFKAARYMDAIMLFYSKNPIWASERFLQDFSKSECYWAPLKLEEAEPGKFLETSYVKEGSHISYRLKNVNEESIKVWRYHHYRSRLAYATKRATMMAALRKAFDARNARNS